MSHSDNELMEDTFIAETELGDSVADQIHQYFICGICNQVYHEPVTLLCQHTFCRACLRELTKGSNPDQSPFNMLPSYNSPKKNKCPLCDLPFVIPPKAINFTINSFLEANLSESDMEIRKRESLKMSLEDEVRDQLKTELYEMVLGQLNKARMLEPLPNPVAGINGAGDFDPNAGMDVNVGMNEGTNFSCCPNEFNPYRNAPCQCLYCNKNKSRIQSVLASLREYLPRTSMELTNILLLGLAAYAVYYKTKL